LIEYASRSESLPPICSSARHAGPRGSAAPINQGNNADLAGGHRRLLWMWSSRSGTAGAGVAVS
jgi:hypothetical protein